MTSFVPDESCTLTRTLSLPAPPLLEVEGRLSEPVSISNIMDGVDDVKSVGAGSVDVLPTCGR